MGYDTHIVVVQECSPMAEYQLDKTKPYSDGSGYPAKKDENNHHIKTGRNEIALLDIASIDLCKIGDSHLNKVHGDALAKAKEHQTEKFYYRYGSNNSKITEDPYGDPLCVAPMADCLEALQKDCNEDGYRRNEWALALLTSIEDSDVSDKFSVAFYGS